MLALKSVRFGYSLARACPKTCHVHGHGGLPHNALLPVTGEPIQRGWIRSPLSATLYAVKKGFFNFYGV